MATGTSRTDNLKSFNPDRDENGQGLSDNPADRPRWDDVHAQLMEEPTGDAETARLASGFKGEDGTEATEAMIPAETLARLGDARPSGGAGKGAADEAVDRATAALGDDRGEA